MPEGWVVAAPADESPAPPQAVTENKKAMAIALVTADFMVKPLFMDVVLNNHSPIRVFPKENRIKAEKGGKNRRNQKISARG